MKRLILFDFDGVLADNLDNMLHFAEQACIQLGFLCQPTRADLEALEIMDMVSYGHQLGIPADRVDQFADTLREIFRRDPQPACTFPGIREVLARQYERHTLAIITGNARDLVEAFLHHYDLHHYIHVIYSGDMPGTRQHKILKALRDAGVRSQDACLVSDAVSDIREARQAGIHSIAVTWGYQRREKLAAEQPEAIVDSPFDLVTVLNHIF